MGEHSGGGVGVTGRLRHECIPHLPLMSMRNTAMREKAIPLSGDRFTAGRCSGVLRGRKKGERSPSLACIPQSRFFPANETSPTVAPVNVPLNLSVTRCLKPVQFPRQCERTVTWGAMDWETLLEKTIPRRKTSESQVRHDFPPSIQPHHTLCSGVWARRCQRALSDGRG